MARILLVEDCPDTQTLVRGTLGHHDVVIAGSLGAAVQELDRVAFDLVLLDLSLPDGDGFALCSRLRDAPELRELPVVFLTGSSETRDKVMAFEMGAQDYVEKPFQPLELRARVDARLRASKQHSSRLVSVGDLCLDPLQLRVTARSATGVVEIELTPHEFQLLRLLSQHRGEVVLRSVILEQIWRNVVVGRRTVDTHVSNLRRKIGPSRVAIEAVRGFGYRLRVEPAEVGGRS